MHLKPRALELLIYLVERHGRLVTKQEILTELWANRFVSDGVLTSSIYEARLALRDAGDEERFIQTVHGRGYRFVAAVETVAAEETAGDGESEPSAEEMAGAVPADASSGLEEQVGDQAKQPELAVEHLDTDWRPALGVAIPGREHWTLEAKLGTGAIGEVWLAAHQKTHAKRVFKFCFDAERVRGLRREVVMLRVLRERLGERQDIAQLLDWEFDRPPFFLETAYTEAGDLLQWAKDRGGIGAVPIEIRIDIVAQVARALAAAHGAGVLHKDLKPSNLLIRKADRMGRPQVCLADFGIGLVTSREALAEAGVTAAGLTETLLSSSTSSGAGTRLYMAPEVIEGKPATAASDLYSLGVLLYQVVVGDFSRSLAPGWQRDVTDDELAEDIAVCVDGVPRNRLGSAADLAERLDRVADRRRERSDRRERAARAERASQRRRRLVATVVAAALLAVVGGVLWSFQRRLSAERVQAERVRWAREEALPEIERLTRAGDFPAAFALTERAEAAIPTDPVLAERWVDISTTGTVRTEPPGARISVQPYASDPDAEWKVLGESPVAGVRLPRGVYRWRIEKEGYEPLDLARRPPDEAVPDANPMPPFELVPTGTIPAGMVRVAGGADFVWLYGFSNMPPVALEPFFIDRFEVTNREFREFVDGGGYTSDQNWPDGASREVLPAFVDHTGRPGPAAWELGTHPKGEDDLPVRGVSWYEAEAYCGFRGKILPTVYHWARAAFHPWEVVQPISNAIIPASNIAGDAPAPVGRHRGMAAYGAYDMAGNVKEWASTATVDGRRYILGGAWNEPGYLFTNPDAQSPARRELTYGFRCMATEDGATLPERLTAPVGGLPAGPPKLQPVSDEVFASFLASARYTPGPLEAAVDARDETPEDWVVETVSFSAAYGGERVPAYVLLPKSVSPPFQVVLFQPPGSANLQPSRDDLRQAINIYLRHLLRSGRAVLFPVLKGTFDRRPATPDPDVGSLSVGAIARDKKFSDLSRSIDYLESRSDIDADRIAYFSVSAVMGAYFAWPEYKRLKALVMVAAGLPAGQPPHRSAVNFAPRVKIPVLMINGRYDSQKPLETAIEPLFDLFGAPDADKKLVLYDSGHIPQPTLLWIKEALDWLDRYLGPVAQTAPVSGVPTGGS